MNSQLNQATGLNSGTICPLSAPLGHKPMTRAELENQDGIKAQHCVAAFIINFLAQANTGWTGQETTVGGREDRQGIDFYLINNKEGRKILVDFSFSSKDGYAVKLEHEWFIRTNDGKFAFQVQFTKALLRRFMPVMDPNFQISFR